MVLDLSVVNVFGVELIHRIIVLHVLNLTLCVQVGNETVPIFFIVEW